MKIVYAGAPAFSVPPLRSMLEAGFEVCAVLTQPDKPVGRKAVLTPTPLKAFAAECGIPVLDFPKVREHVAELSAAGADCMVTCAYGQILTAEVLAAFSLGVYNIHASLLPRWRGASPIQHALLAGDEFTGITVMRTDVGLDTGDMLLVRKTAIDPDDTAETLAARLSLLGGECIVEALRDLAAGTAVFVPQPEAGVTLCKKIRKEECAVDFRKTPQEVCDLIRAMNPAPLAYAYLRGAPVNLYFAAPAPAEEAGGAQAGEVVRADKTGIYVRTGEGVVKVLELQAAGGKRMRAADFVNGRKIAVGDVLCKEPR